MDEPNATPSTSSSAIGIYAGRDFIAHAPVHVHVTETSEVQNPEPEPKCVFQVKDPVHTFHGREKFLEDLHNRIQELQKQGMTISVLSQTSSIIGLGGVGKTETVRKYIKQFGNEYDNIAWIDAEQPSEATKQFLILADCKLKIQLNDQNGRPREFAHVLEDVYEKLCRKPKRLLIIFDNAEALEDSEPLTDGIRKFLPAQTTTIEPPIVLITSRQQRWTDVNVIKLGLWDTEECVGYIFKRLKLDDTPGNRSDANELAELFDRLPIAVQVAVSVIHEQWEERRKVSNQVYGIQNLISDYCKGKNDLGEDENPLLVQSMIQTLLDVSLDKISKHKQGKLAIEILAFMAYLSPTKIPKVIIQWLFPQIADQVLDAALGLLIRYSIIEGVESYLTIHRVFQDVIITSLKNADASELQSNRNAFCSCIFGYCQTNPDYGLQASSIFAEFSMCKDEMTILSLLTNTFVTHAETLDRAQDGHSDIFTNIIHATMHIIKNSLIDEYYSYIETVAECSQTFQYELAIKFYMTLIDFGININKLPPRNTFSNLWSIAETFHENGKIENALEIYNVLLHGGKLNNHEAFNIFITQGEEKQLGALDPSILTTKNNLALCLSEQGKNDEALELYYAVLEAREKVSGAIHPDTLTTKNNIALCLSEQGKIDEALELYYAVLEAREKVLGALHPSTLSTKNDIATCLLEQGKKETSLELFVAVLEAREKVLGTLHPDTLGTREWIKFCLNNSE